MWHQRRCLSIWEETDVKMQQLLVSGPLSRIAENWDLIKKRFRNIVKPLYVLGIGNWKRKDSAQGNHLLYLPARQLFGSHRFCFVIHTSHFASNSPARFVSEFLFVHIFICILLRFVFVFGSHHGFCFAVSAVFALFSNCTFCFNQSTSYALLIAASAGLSNGFASAYSAS